MTYDEEEKKVFNLPTFDPQSIQPNDQCLFIGARGTGKTVAMKSILNHLTRRQAMRGIVYAPNYFLSWSIVVPDGWVHTDVKQATLNYLMTEKEAKEDKNGVFCVMDNVSAHFSELLLNNRRYQTTLLISSPDGRRNILPETRGAVTSIFLFAGLSDCELNHLYLRYAGLAFHNLRMFKNCYRQVTSKPFTALYINRNPSNLTVAQWTPNLADSEKKINMLEDPYLQRKDAGLATDVEKDDDPDTEPEEEDDDGDDCPPPPSSPTSSLSRHPPRPSHPSPSSSSSPPAPPPPPSSCNIFNYISSLFAPLRLCLE